MKRKVILFGTLAIATVSLVSCGNDENVMPEAGGSKAEFSASINGTAKTRAFDRTWNKGDAIGIYGTSGGKAYANVCYTTAEGNGYFAPKGDPIYYQDNSEVTFTGYYPWTDLQGATSVTADTRLQASHKQFDFLWAQAKGSKAAPNVAFTFHHQMAKLVLTVKKGADVSFGEVKEAVLGLEGFRHEGSFDVATGTAGATGNEGEMWQFANSGETTWNAPQQQDASAETVSYTLIFFPQAFDAPLEFAATLEGRQTFSAALDFTAANGSAGDKDAKNQWVAGRQYNLGVTLHKTGITVDGCTIAPWNEAEAGNVDAQ